MKIVPILLVLLSVGYCTNPYFIANVQCSCPQFLNSKDCSQQWSCQWITISPATTPSSGYCTQNECISYTTQAQCAKAKVSCYYQAPTTTPASGTPAQVCFQFSSCEKLTLAANQTCANANAHCMANPTAATQGQSPCISRTKTSQTQCSEFTTQETCGDATTTATTTSTSEGYCYWNGNLCTLITSCSEIKTKEICSQMNNACQWQVNSCVPLTCANLSQTNCTYIRLSPVSFTNIQPCLWNSTACVNSTVTSLTQSTCASNTASHYRWVGLTNGFCAQCNPHKYVLRNQCECGQLLQQSECQASLNCQWTTTTSTTGTTTSTCTVNVCTNYTIQQQCAQTTNCYWDLTATTPSCQAFTNCSALKGTTSQACLAQTVQCPGTTGTLCTNQLLECTSIKEPNICYNSIGKEGYCYYQANGANVSSCAAYTSCTSITEQLTCIQFASACVWNYSSPKGCQPKTCSEYLTQASCTFVLPSMTSNNVNICYWNPNTKLCQSFDNSIGFDVNTCFANTGRTHHWSEPANTNRGLCVPCHFSNILNVKSQCSCTELVNYTDCALASPKCMWNSQNSQCLQQNCAFLTSQTSCILSNTCYWNNKNMSCVNASQGSCGQLLGNTQQECLAQSLACPGTSGGKCTSSKSPCSDFTTYYQCFGSVGTDGICQWNEVNKSCAGISQCSMITTQTQCELVANACQWVGPVAPSTTYTCQTLTCSALSTSACTFVRSSPSQNYEIQQCTISGAACANGSGNSSLSSSTCYVQSGRTSKWVASDGPGSCQKCTYAYMMSVLFIVLLMVI